jgi:hypothetical protein
MLINRLEMLIAIQKVRNSAKKNMQTGITPDIPPFEKIFPFAN